MALEFKVVEPFVDDFFVFVVELAGAELGRVVEKINSWLLLVLDLLEVKTLEVNDVYRES